MLLFAFSRFSVNAVKRRDVRYHVMTIGLYVKINTLFGKSLTGIHDAVCEVYGESEVDHSTMSQWTSSFREGRTGVEGDPRNTVARTQIPLGILP